MPTRNATHITLLEENNLHDKLYYKINIKVMSKIGLQAVTQIVQVRLWFLTRQNAVQYEGNYEIGEK